MKKTKILSVLLIFITLVAAMGLTSCMSSTDPNREQPGEDPEKLFEFDNSPFSYNPELEGTMMFCRKHTFDHFEQLIAVTRDGREIVIIADMGNVTVDGVTFRSVNHFDYYRNRLYLSFIQIPTFNEMAYIDLNKGDGRYDIKYLTYTENFQASYSFVVTFDSIYCGDLYNTKYSYIYGTWEYTSFSNMERNINALKYDKDGNNLILWRDDGSAMLIDNATGEQQEILTDLYMIENVYRSKILCIKDAHQDYREYVLCEYDIKSGKITTLSDVTAIFSWSSAKDVLLPCGNNRYIYSRVLYDSGVSQIIISENGIQEIVAEFDYDMGVVISLISESLVSITNNGLDGEFGTEIEQGELLNVTLDINTGVVTDSDIDYYYCYEVWADGFDS